ncbi:MAG: DUF3368 domain-containing protein [Bacteroidota bacterium]
MSDPIIIADASPLIALEDIGELDILHRLYGEILITDLVRNEIHASLPPWIKISDEYDPQQKQLLELELDAGEASAIALAIAKQPKRLIIDEIKGRSVAKRLGLSVIGTLGIIILAKEKGVIQSGKLILQKLEQHGFWISAKLKQQIIKRLKEEDI